MRSRGSAGRKLVLQARLKGKVGFCLYRFCSYFARSCSSSAPRNCKALETRSSSQAVKPLRVNPGPTERAFVNGLKEHMAAVLPADRLHRFGTKRLWRKSDERRGAGQSSSTAGRSSGCPNASGYGASIIPASISQPRSLTPRPWNCGMNSAPGP
jgi:hypothetical protein